MKDIPDEVVERMVALVKDAAGTAGIAPVSAVEAEARAIMALLPQPIDPLLLRAREIAAQEFETIEMRVTAGRTRLGLHDDSPTVQAAFRAFQEGVKA
jgi:hypothetical protein